MANREEFGKYLLLKKLTEDPLGETFRAGRVGDQGVEQVVLLRAFNGPRLDTARLAQELPGRAPVQQALKSPNIGNGVDLGAIRNVPYVAYDYISGKNLASLLAEASRQSNPIAVDHALLISERIAQALAVAFETRAGDGRILHGFVVPQLVRISNEGETRVLGFEVGVILQQMAARGAFEPAISTYLAPEVLAGEPPTKSDDVYSLGTVLFHLLTGSPPSSSDPNGLAQEIERSTTAEDGQPLPPALTELLKKSLTPRDRRIPEAVTWHKALNKVITEAGYNATTFNLAFFMHNLFRSDIEQETEEIEAERTIQLDRPVPSTESEAATTPEGATPPPADGTGEDFDTEPTGGSKAGLWLGLAAVLLLAAVGAVYYYLGSGPIGGGEAPEIEPTQEATIPPPVEIPPSPLDESAAEAEAEDQEAEAEAQAAELQAQLQEMIDARSRDVEAKLQAQYDARIQKLQEELARTQEAAERARERARAEPDEPAVTASGKGAGETAGAETEVEIPKTAGAKPASEQEAATATGGNIGAPAPAEPAPRQARSQVDDSPQTEGSSPRSRERTEARQPETRETQQTRPATQPAQVRPPQLVRSPNPRYPEIARRMNREATVLLRVLVDERGRVVKAERIGKKVGSGFDEAALEAARQARFQPGTEDGEPQAMWTTLRIEFRP